MADQDVETKWTGRDLYDVNGEKIGTVEDVRYGDMAMALKWLVVKSGFLGTKQILIPAGEVRVEGDRLLVPYEKEFVKDAPDAKHDDYVLPEEEEKVCSYYGMEYVRELDRTEEGCVDE